MGCLITLVPVAAWLVVFYLQDRLEPEPKGHVLGITTLGALVALTLAIPIVRDIFRVQDWLGGAGWFAELLGGILIVGVVQEYLKYAVVRYTIYNSPEFDERVDGIVYGAAGLALPRAHLYSVISSASLRRRGHYSVSITALAQPFRGLMGYLSAPSSRIWGAGGCPLVLHTAA
jgi:RsiW-degrading membrane proteinase PrsW (M82 family)